MNKTVRHTVLMPCVTDDKFVDWCYKSRERKSRQPAFRLVNTQVLKRT